MGGISGIGIRAKDRCVFCNDRGKQGWLNGLGSESESSSGSEPLTLEMIVSATGPDLHNPTEIAVTLRHALQVQKHKTHPLT